MQGYGEYTKAKLYMCVKGDEELLNKYKNHVESHNNHSKYYPNSGFDIFFPDDVVVEAGKVEFVKMNIICEMRIHNREISQTEFYPTGYYSYPRSSISKTPLMLANSVGIIDSGYRGEIIGAFRNLSTSNYTIEKHSRLLQICAPDLRPIHVELVDEAFFNTTERGSGGFGSTGR